MELQEIIKLFKENNITGYQVAQDTDLTQVGVDKILNGKSKNPLELAILKYHLELMLEHHFLP